MPVQTRIDLYIEDDAPTTVQPNGAWVHVNIARYTELYVEPAKARTLAAGLMIAADELDPQTDDPEVARTLRIAMNGGAA